MKYRYPDADRGVLCIIKVGKFQEGFLRSFRIVKKEVGLAKYRLMFGEKKAEETNRGQNSKMRENSSSRD